MNEKQMIEGLRVMTSSPSTPGEVLLDLLESNELSVTEAAKRLGVGRITISNLVNGCLRVLLRRVGHGQLGPILSTDNDKPYLVDCDNEFGVFHPCKMLDSTTDANGDVEFWSNHFTRLADLYKITLTTSVLSEAECY